LGPVSSSPVSSLFSLSSFLSFFFTVLLAFINSARGFHCDDSIDVYSVL
jgi:hypothetical protein